MIASAFNGWRERAFGPSLYLGLGFGLAVLATPTRSWTAWALAAIVLGAGVLVTHRGRVSHALWPMLAFGAWLVVHTLFISPVYRPEGVYAGVLFACAAVLASCAGEGALARLVSLWLAGVAMLALWGLAQAVAGVATMFGTGPRASALFPSPNTLATVLDVALLATLGAYLGRGRRVSVGLLALVLFAALVATQSRGGALAFSLGTGVLAVCARKAGIGVPARVWAGLLLAALAVIGLFEWLSLPAASAWFAGGPISGAPSLVGRVVATASTEGHVGIRLGLYRLAWEAIGLHPFAGSGYLSFATLYKASGLQILSQHGTTRYVHNDYLQLWLETGLPGVIALLAALGLAARRGWGRLSAARVEERVVCCAALAGLAALCAHAALDFPFYVPGLMVLGGAAIGVLCREPAMPVCASQPPRDDSSSRPGAMNLARIARSVLLLGTCAWLAAPAAAEWSAYVAQRALQSGDSATALRGYAMARALAPYNPRYHWALGVIRAQQAVLGGDREMAHAADSHFAAGAAADSGDVLNPLHRLRLNRDHAALFCAPRSDSVLVDWARRLRDRQPGNLSLQREYIVTLLHARRVSQARAELERLMARYPEAGRLRALSRGLADLPRPVNLPP